MLIFNDCDITYLITRKKFQEYSYSKIIIRGRCHTVSNEFQEGHFFMNIGYIANINFVDRHNKSLAQI